MTTDQVVPAGGADKQSTAHLKRLQQLQERLRQHSAVSGGQPAEAAQLDAFTAEYTAISGDIARDIDSVPAEQLQPLHAALFDTFHLLTHCAHKVDFGVGGIGSGGIGDDDGQRQAGEQPAAPPGHGKEWDKLKAVENRLEYLHERGAYNDSEVVQLGDQLEEIAAAAATTDSDSVVSATVAHCRNLVREMLGNGAVQAGPFIRGLIERLRGIQRTLADMKAATNAPPTKKAKQPRVDVDALHRLQTDVSDIEQSRVDGKFVPPKWSAETDAVPTGQAQVAALLEEVHDDIYDLLCVYDEESSGSSTHKAGTAAKSLVNRVKSTYGRLANMVTHSLAHHSVDQQLHQIQGDLLALHRQLQFERNEWYFLQEEEQSLRRKLIDTMEKQHNQEERVRSVRQQLLQIDSNRVDGRFVGDADAGSFAPSGQGTLTELLERDFALLREIEADQ